MFIFMYQCAQTYFENHILKRIRQSYVDATAACDALITGAFCVSCIHKYIYNLTDNFWILSHLKFRISLFLIWK